MEQKKLVEQIEKYKELAKENPNIDLSALAMNAFQNSTAEQNFLSKKQKRWAYLISIGFPPFGLIFALKFFFSDKQDAKTAAWICIALTVFSIVAFLVIFQVILSSSGVSPQQIEQINPQQIQQLLQ